MLQTALKAITVLTTELMAVLKPNRNQRRRRNAKGNQNVATLRELLAGVLGLVVFFYPFVLHACQTEKASNTHQVELGSNFTHTVTSTCV